MRWEFDDGNGEVTLTENRLCFGLKCAPYIFSLLSDMVVDMVKAKGVERIIDYLDDFLITESTFENCMDSQALLLNTLRWVGFAVSWKKSFSSIKGDHISRYYNKYNVSL